MRANDLKESNRVSILNILRKENCSRADLSNVLGMSRPAVSMLVDELIEEQLLIEIGTGNSTSAGGRRPILLDLNWDAVLILSVYFNEDWYEIGITDLSMNKLYASEKEKIVIDPDYRKTFDDISKRALNLINRVREEGYQQPILACGITTRGLVNVRNGTLRYSSGISDWKDVPVQQYMSDALGLPVYFENDARSYALSELFTDHHESLYNFVCIYVGIGIGTGVVIDGDIFRGSNSGAVNMGHTTVKEDGPLCVCGNYGCWESLASVKAFLKELEARDSKYHSLNFQSALQKYNEGDPIVRDVLINYTGYWLGVGVANILNVFNPEKVIILGEVTLADQELKQKIESTAKEKASVLERRAEIQFAEYSQNMRLRGAAAVVNNKFFSLDHHMKMCADYRERNE